MANGTGKKILIVDDEIDVLTLLRCKLEGEYDIVVAMDGAEALRAVEEEKPDAVLLDLVMEGMSGLDVLKAIRRHNKKLPVFLLTAHSDYERLAEANRLNASGFIAKTGNLDKEFRSIRSALGLSRKYRA